MKAGDRAAGSPPASRVNDVGGDLPLTLDTAEVFRTARASGGPLSFDPGSGRQLASKGAEQFSRQCRGATAKRRLKRRNGEGRIVHSRRAFTQDPAGWPCHLMMQVITECNRAKQRLVAQQRVTQILAEAATPETAAPQLLQALGEALAWDLGAVWRLDRPAGVLRLVAFWRRTSVEAPQFEAASRVTAARPGIGLRGRVWQSGEPAYLPELASDVTFLRAPMAAAEGLQTGCAIPILLAGDVLGVIEFFSRARRPLDAELVKMMSSIGSQLGQFTERKRAEAALQQAQAELTHLARVSTLGELAASIAHEVNQPLGAMVNSAGACARWLAAHKLEEARRSASRVIAEGHRASEILGGIRALARKAPPQPGWLELNEAIGEVLAMLRGELHRHRVALQTQLDPALPRLWADRVQVQQVLLNLLMNAVEALSGVGEGPRELWVSSQHVMALPAEAGPGTPEAAGPYASVAVRDTGPGLDPQGLERLFEAFYTTKPQGLGMGLAISRSIIEAHGGRLWARTSMPRGAVFEFALPIRAGGSS